MKKILPVISLLFNLKLGDMSKQEQLSLVLVKTLSTCLS